MRRKLTEKDVLTGRLALAMLTQHRSNAIWKNRWGEEIPDEKKQALDAMSRLGITGQKGVYHSPVGIDFTTFCIYVDKASVKLHDWEMDLLNNDFIVKFIVSTISNESAPYIIQYPAEDILNNRDNIDNNIVSSMNRVLLCDEYNENYILFRNYKYPTLPTMLQKVYNYNVWDIVEKVKGMFIL